MGFQSYMIISLKNNKRERVSSFELMKNFKEGKNIQVSFNKTSTPKQLKRIRKDLQGKNQTKTLTTLLYMFLLILILIYVIGFVKI